MGCITAAQEMARIFLMPSSVATALMAVCQPDGSGKQPLCLFNGQDIRDPGSLWRFDQGNCLPGFVDYPEVKTSGHKDRV